LALTPSQRDTLENGETFWRRLTCEPHDRLVPDMAREEPFRSEQALGFEAPALLLAAIRLESQALGLIALGARQAGHFHANDLNLARGVARQAAQAILNARHQQESAARARHAKQFVRF
jgi:GAF domain-containing protein